MMLGALPQLRKLNPISLARPYSMSSESKSQFKLTPEQLALSAARKAKKQLESPEAKSTNELQAGPILERDWVPLLQHEPSCKSIRVMTWNLLAQCLTRRDLFPTSTCLKAAQREHMIHRELVAHDADVLCLQEVDRLPKLLPFLAHAGYSHHYSAGPGKQHGCLIAFKSLLYTKIADRLIQYDTQSIRDGSGIASRGLSFQTKNIANIVALGRKGDLDQGYIIATTHLFWHPKYRYERARQVGILFREVKNFRSQLGLHHWPCIIAGDFNFPPDDVCYSLISGDTLLPEQEAALNQSRVVHVSVDPTVPRTQVMAEDGEDGDPDRVITSARIAIPEDGLMTVPELVVMLSSQQPIRSAYDEGLKMYQEPNSVVSTFGARVTLPLSRHGTHEPEYTSYTHYWKATLDYILIIDPDDRLANVIGLLKPHQVEDLIPGLPKQGVCGSDHVSLAADLCWEDINSVEV